MTGWRMSLVAALGVALALVGTSVAVHGRTMGAVAPAAQAGARQAQVIVPPPRPGEQPRSLSTLQQDVDRLRDRLDDQAKAIQELQKRVKELEGPPKIRPLDVQGGKGPGSGIR